MITPFPDIMGRLLGQNFTAEDADQGMVSGWEHLGAFLTGFLATSAIGWLL